MQQYRATSLAVLFLLLTAPAAAGELLTNDSVTAMTKAGLSASVIVAKIHSAQTDFDVSTDALIQLKQEGVADEVIHAMIEATEDATANPAPAGGKPLTRAPATPTTPLPPIPSESGIYYSQNLGQEEQLVLLEPSVYTQSKETGVWKQALTYGIAKVRYKAVLPGQHAHLLIETRRPTFYFFFDVAHGSLSNSGTAWGPATSANEFVLARMDVKKSTRELEVGEYGQYTGHSYGVASKIAQPFDYERLAPGIYRVTPKADLADGEYCFLYGGSVAASGTSGGPKLFDFAVKLAARERKVSGRSP
jgi:hypothetical protein